MTLTGWIGVLSIAFHAYCAHIHWRNRQRGSWFWFGVSMVFVGWGATLALAGLGVRW